MSARTPDGKADPWDEGNGCQSVDDETREYDLLSAKEAALSLAWYKGGFAGDELFVELVLPRASGTFVARAIAVTEWSSSVLAKWM